jgi:hypothetical protein
MTTYAGVIAGPAAVLKSTLKLRSYAAPEPKEASISNYTETASDRAGIGALTDLLRNERVVFKATAPRNHRLGTATKCRPLPHQMDVHNRQGSRQNGRRLSRHFQRVIITVTRY